MAWPPPVLPINRTNADPQQDTHPNDHNALALAVNDITAHVLALEADLAERAASNTLITALSGQTFQAGETNLVTWSNASDPAWGVGPIFTVPANRNGLWLITLELTGPSIAPPIVSDIGLSMRNTDYIEGATNGDSTGACVGTVSALNRLNAGDQFWAYFANRANIAGSVTGTMTVARLAT